MFKSNLVCRRVTRVAEVVANFRHSRYADYAFEREICLIRQGDKIRGRRHPGEL